MSWSLVSGLTYATVPSWYTATFRDMKFSMCMPKFRFDGKKYPLLVWVCGGAFKVMDRDVWWPQWIDFARRGCIVASVEYRTSNEAVFPAALEDIKAAIRYFKANAEQYSIDPDKIFVAGESAGGTLASLAGVTGECRQFDKGAYQEYDSCVSGVIDFYGMTDLCRAPLAPAVSNDTSGAEEQFLGIEGDPTENRKKASAVTYVNENTPPFLIVHGDQDPLVPIRQSEIMYETLVKAGVRAEFYVLEGESHGADAFYQKEMMERYWDFMQSVMEAKDAGR